MCTSWQSNEKQVERMILRMHAQCKSIQPRQIEEKFERDMSMSHEEGSSLIPRGLLNEVLRETCNQPQN